MTGVLDFISNFITFTGNFWIDTIIFSVIGLVCGKLAYVFVGSFYDDIGYYNRSLMKISYKFMFMLFAGVIIILLLIVVSIVRILMSINLVGYMILIPGVIFTVKTYKDFTEHLKNYNSDKKLESKKICPWCRGQLVLRNGPHGEFHGCSNFVEKNCRYTESII